jgi:hypothetical protein
MRRYDLEKQLRVTCHSCGKENAFTLFNPTMIAAQDVVHCSHCRGAIGRWGDLEGSEKPASARPECSAGEKEAGAALPSPPLSRNRTGRTKADAERPRPAGRAAAGSPCDEAMDGSLNDLHKPTAPGSTLLH